MPQAIARDSYYAARQALSIIYSSISGTRVV